MTQKMTLGKFLKKVWKKARFREDIEMLSLPHGLFIIYANFLHISIDGLLGMLLLDDLCDAVMSKDGNDVSFFE